MMTRFSTFTRQHFVTLVLTSVLAGFVLILIELLLTEHYDGIQLIAPISCALGIALVAAALMRWRGRMVLAALLLALSLTGLFGAFEHYEEREGEADEASALQRQVVLLKVSDEASDQPVKVARDEDGGEREREEGEREEGETEEGNPPPLAPLSLSGLAFLGALGVMAQGARPEARNAAQPD